MKHTQAPWFFDETTLEGTNLTPLNYSIRTESERTFSGRVIANVSVAAGTMSENSYRYEGEEALANARLIAAAPDLLDALANLLVACLSEEEEQDYVGVVKQAKEALEKATGR